MDRRIKLTHRTYDVRDVTDTRSTGGPEVQYFFTRCDVDMIHPTQNTGRKLGAERVPNTVLDLCPIHTPVNRDPLLAVDGLAGSNVLGDEHRFLALGDEDASMLVGLEDHIDATSATSWTSPPSTTAPTASTIAAAPPSSSASSRLNTTTANTTT